MFETSNLIINRFMIGNQSESIKCYEKPLKVTQRGQTVLLKYIIKKANVRMWLGIFLLIRKELWKLLK